MKMIEEKNLYNWIQTETNKANYISNKQHNYYEGEKANPYNSLTQYLK